MDFVEACNDGVGQAVGEADRDEVAAVLDFPVREFAPAETGGFDDVQEQAGEGQRRRCEG